MRILLVDDRESNLRFMEMLCQLDNYETIIIAEGTGVVALATETQPDLIVLDMFLPGGMNGLDVLHALRSAPKTMHIPVLATTAGPDICTRKKVLNAGANDYLMKPFSVKEWQSAVNNLLNPSPTPLT